MPFTFHTTKIKDLLIIEPHEFNDDRGKYLKYYEKEIFEKNGITCEFFESSDIHSNKGALRGLHYQTEPSQAKLLHLIQGAICDVAVDLRKNSETYGKWHGELLNKENNKVIFIPEGFAHGFLALEDNTVFSYQCAGKYIPENCGGIVWNDETININWFTHFSGEVILSEKDKYLQSFLKFDKENK